jgi:hypothetical protein
LMIALLVATGCGKTSSTDQPLTLEGVC